MDHRSISVKNRNGNIFSLEAYWIGNTIAVNPDIHDSCIYELDFDLAVPGFPSQLLADPIKSLPLDFLDDIFEFRKIYPLVGPDPFVVDRRRRAFDQLSGD